MPEYLAASLLVGFLVGATVFAVVVALVLRRSDRESAALDRVARCDEPGCGARFTDRWGLDQHRLAAHPDTGETRWDTR